MNSEDQQETFQIPLEAAERYESAFVPAFFAQWAPVLCRAAGISARTGPGCDVLDVACGTGIVARTAAGLLGSRGSVTGVDLNEAMLTVARRVAPGIEWHQGDAATLPFADESFDVVLSQMAMMFFPDRAAAVAQMRRVTRPGGSVGVLVPADLEGQAAFAPFVEMAARHAGPDATALLGSYFGCGDLEHLRTVFSSAGLHVTSATVEPGIYRAPSVEAFVVTEVESTPLIDRLSPAEYAAIKAGASEVLAPFTRSDGSVEAPFGSNVVIGLRP